MKNKNTLLRYGILLGSITFIIIGVVRGEYTEVLTKAVNICLQCIGIG